MQHARNDVAIKFNFGVNKSWHNVGCRVALAERSRSLSKEMRLTVAERSRSEQSKNEEKFEEHSSYHETQHATDKRYLAYGG